MLNNNLVDLTQNYRIVSKGLVTTQAELDAILNDTSAFKPNSIYEYTIDCGSGLTLQSGMNVIRGYRYQYNDNYSWQEAITYATSGISIKYGSKISGVWTSWVNK